MRGQKRIGLARVLSKRGYCSRVQAAVLIRAGRVALNGRIAKDPESPVRMLQDRIEIDGSPLEKACDLSHDEQAARSGYHGFR